MLTKGEISELIAATLSVNLMLIVSAPTPSFSHVNQLVH